MDLENKRKQLRAAWSALVDGKFDAITELLAGDAVFAVDWKGEGVFEGGALHGRRRYVGPSGVEQFFERMFALQKVVAVEHTRGFVDDETNEVLLMGRMQWSTASGGYASDFSVRWVFGVDGKVTLARFLTLPDGHIDTFIPDHRASEEIELPRYKKTVRDFQKLYFDAYLYGRTWSETYFRDIPIYKCPLDLWVYQELIHRLKPALIIETGTCAGGSALYLASMCEMHGAGRVVTIDTVRHIDGQPPHDRITYLVGSSVDPAVVAQVRAMIPAGGVVMAVLDSDHRAPHVFAELEAYADLISVGSYLIVEDTGLNGHPIKPNYGPGPTEAIREFVGKDDRFVIDFEQEKFLMTWNHLGYLRKTRA